MQITSIERRRNKKDRISVFIDGAYSFTMPEEDYISMNLYELKEITREQLDHIKNTVCFRAAKSEAVRFVSLKVRSEREIRNKLYEDGYDPDTVDKVIDELKSMGYVDDRIYARKYIYDRQKLKPKAKKMLRLELAGKGIPEEIASEVLGNWEIDELSVARELVRKKFGKYDLKDEKIIKKVYSFLRHRGFSYELIGDLIENLAGGT